MIYEFFKRHWVSCAGMMSGAFLLLIPVGYGAWPLPLLLIFLHSPAYMAHQVEEHAGDRFRSYVNHSLCGGREGLTAFDVISINVGVVWSLNFAALYIARFADAGWTLSAPYLLIVNAVSHIGWALRFRTYNPGLGTSILLFLPLGGATIAIVPATAWQHGIGFGAAIILHAIIIFNLFRRLRGLERSAS